MKNAQCAILRIALRRNAHCANCAAASAIRISSSASIRPFKTRLKIPAPVLKGSIRRQEVYDDPYRSARGRTITHAFYIELEPNASLPKVKGGDDARQARWVPLGEIDPRNLFEDHYFIIQDLLGAA